MSAQAAFMEAYLNQNMDKQKLKDKIDLYFHNTINYDCQSFWIDDQPTGRSATYHGWWKIFNTFLFAW